MPAGQSPFSDAACADWFEALKQKGQANVQKAVAGESTELDLQKSKFTQIPHGVFVAFSGLTTLNLRQLHPSRRWPSPSASCRR